MLQWHLRFKLCRRYLHGSTNFLLKKKIIIFHFPLITVFTFHSRVNDDGVELLILMMTHELPLLYCKYKHLFVRRYYIAWSFYISACIFLFYLKNLKYTVLHLYKKFESFPSHSLLLLVILKRNNALFIFFWKMRWHVSSCILFCFECENILRC